MTWYTKRDSIQVPKKIGKSPIIESIIDFRFARQEGLPAEAVFGMIFEKIRSEFPQVENLPILQIPEAVRDNEPNLKYQPHYRLRNGNFLIQVGPASLSFLHQQPYSGWDAFCSKIKPIIDNIWQLSLIGEITRIGVRYINVFEGNIWDKTRVKVMSDDVKFPTEEMSIQSVLTTGKFQSQIRVSNNVQIIQAATELKEKSLIDIDAFLDGSWKGKEEIWLFIEEAHAEVKKTFFALLQDEYISTLEPSYD